MRVWGAQAWKYRLQVAPMSGWGGALRTGSRSKSNKCSNWSMTLHFPDDLVRAQRDWLVTYQQLAVPRLRHMTALRRRLLDLSSRIQWHPFWSTPSGRTPAARVELRRLAHRQEQRERRAA